MSNRFLGCTALLLLFLISGLALALFLAGEYNALRSEDEAIASRWSQVQMAYERRGELVSKLVAAVGDAAEVDQATLKRVVEARSQVGRLELEGTRVVEDRQALERFEEAQEELAKALSRLLEVVERTPELRSETTVRALTVQLEGTEGRIAAERRRFDALAREFNLRLRRFPTRWFVRLLGWPFEEKVQFEAISGSERAAPVEL